MRKAFVLFFAILSFQFIPFVINAQANSYTRSEVEQHSGTKDCYMIFDNKVYDVTAYLADHEERFQDIAGWCGQDMTEDFKTKGGEGRDHTGGYRVLEKYLIGELDTTTSETTTNINWPVIGAIGFLVSLGAIVSYLWYRQR